MVSFSSVAKRYPGGHEALRDVSFALDPGELFEDCADRAGVFAAAALRDAGTVELRRKGEENSGEECGRDACAAAGGEKTAAIQGHCGSFARGRQISRPNIAERSQAADSGGEAIRRYGLEGPVLYFNALAPG